MEHAGGAATDGHQAILDITPSQLHQRTPLYIGSRGDVAEVHRLLAQTKQHRLTAVPSNRFEGLSSQRPEPRRSTPMLAASSMSADVIACA
jgi:Fructose-1-6-bisphosphatase, C-terminal domain